MSKRTFWKAVTTVKMGLSGYGKGNTKHFKDLESCKRFMSQVELDENLKDVKAFRFVPMRFDDPAEGIRSVLDHTVDDVW